MSRVLLVALLLLAACGGSSGSSGANHLPPAHGPTISSACPIFPADNPWNTDISGAPLDPRSGAWVASVGSTAAFHPDFGSVYGIPYAVADVSIPWAGTFGRWWPGRSSATG